jgi:hypothetical protein
MEVKKSPEDRVFIDNETTQCFEIVTFQEKFLVFFDDYSFFDLLCVYVSHQPH